MCVRMHVSMSLQVKFHCSCLTIFILTNVFATNICAMCLQIKCLYSKTQNILTVCVPPEDMSGRPFYTTMNPHDLSGDTTDLDYERSTVDSCAEYCYDYQYFGLEWGGRCSCGNSYGLYGAVDEEECSIECGGSAASA